MPWPEQDPAASTGPPYRPYASSQSCSPPRYRTASRPPTSRPVSSTATATPAPRVAVSAPLPAWVQTGGAPIRSIPGSAAGRSPVASGVTDATSGRARMASITGRGAVTAKPPTIHSGRTADARPASAACRLRPRRCRSRLEPARHRRAALGGRATERGDRRRCTAQPHDHRLGTVSGGQRRAREHEQQGEDGDGPAVATVADEREERERDQHECQRPRERIEPGTRQEGGRRWRTTADRPAHQGRDGQPRAVDIDAQRERAGAGDLDPGNLPLVLAADAGTAADTARGQANAGDGRGRGPTCIDDADRDEVRPGPVRLHLDAHDQVVDLARLDHRGRRLRRRRELRPAGRSARGEHGGTAQRQQQHGALDRSRSSSASRPSAGQGRARGDRHRPGREQQARLEEDDLTVRARQQGIHVHDVAAEREQARGGEARDGGSEHGREAAEQSGRCLAPHGDRGGDHRSCPQAGASEMHRDDQHRHDPEGCGVRAERESRRRSRRRDDREPRPPPGQGHGDSRAERHHDGRVAGAALQDDPQRAGGRRLQGDEYRAAGHGTDRPPRARRAATVSLRANAAPAIPSAAQAAPARPSGSPTRRRAAAARRTRAVGAARSPPPSRTRPRRRRRAGRRPRASATPTGRYRRPAPARPQSASRPAGAARASAAGRPTRRGRASTCSRPRAR